MSGTRKKRRTYWYRRTFEGCPVCGRGRSYRTRVYGRKPRQPVAAHFVTIYDYCDV